MQRFLSVALILLVCSAVDALRKNSCKVLVLEGGGTKGAYQAGAFKAMAEFLPPETIKYDVIAGSSVGALGGLLFTATEIGKEKETAKNLMNLWEDITSDDVLTQWPYLGILRGFFDKPGFLDNSPLLDYIQRIYKQWNYETHRKYTILMVNANTAKAEAVTEAVGGINLSNYVVASAAVPGIFPYSKINNSIYIDGGSIDNTNIPGAIKRCREIVGDDDSAITIDIIMTNAINNYVWMNMQKEKTYTIYSRNGEIAEEFKSYWYLKNALEVYTDVNFRYILIPKESLPNYPVVPLSFDKESLRKMAKIGYDQMKELISSGHKNFREKFANLASTPRHKIRLH